MRFFDRTAVGRRGMLAIGPALLLRANALAQRPASPPPPIPPLPEIGFQPIFDGKTLSGWDGDPSFWRVEGGAITGETSATHQPRQNTFCIWRGAQPGDFELKAQYRISGGNSGFQYRSVERIDIAKWVMQGYQADIDAEQRYTGQLYEERDRGFLAPRGTFSYAASSSKPGSIGAVGDPDQLRGFIRDNDWNDVHIVARGDSLTHLLNGHVMCAFLDDDTAHRKREGLIGIQLHVTTAGMKIEARNIRIKTF
jgi:Domain of Unknown Function (DUF1080)